MSDTDYRNGERSVWLRILRQCIAALGYGSEFFPPAPEDGYIRLVAEREELIAALRAACADHGDNDWTPDLALTDIFEKHLMRHIEEEALDDFDRSES